MAKIYGSMVTFSNHQRRMGLHGVTQCKRSSRACLRYRTLELQLYLVLRHHLNPHHAMPPCHLFPLLTPNSAVVAPSPWWTVGVHRGKNELNYRNDGNLTTPATNFSYVTSHCPRDAVRPTDLRGPARFESQAFTRPPSCPFRVHSHRCNHVTTSTGSSNGPGVSSISS